MKRIRGREGGNLVPRVPLSPPHPRDPENEVEGRVGGRNKHELKQTRSDAHLVIVRVVAVKHFRNLSRSLFHLGIFPNKQVSFIHVTNVLILNTVML